MPRAEKMKASINAISLYYPEKVVTNDELKMMYPEVRMDELTRLTGVLQRHLAGSDETAVDMAEAAALELFMEHNVRPGQIDFILLCTTWPDFITPTSACILQDRLGIPESAGALDINQGCTGYVYGLSVAKGLVESGSAKNVLLLTSETISKSIHAEDAANRAIFGDGATATLISAVPDDSKNFIGGMVFGTDGSGYEEIIIKVGGARYPSSKFKTEDYKDEQGNYRNDGCFYMNGPAIFTFSTKVSPLLISDILEKNKTKFEDVDAFIFHQANRIILETIFKKNKIPAEKAVMALENVGNTVSSTIPIALYHWLKNRETYAPQNILLGAFGVGLSWAGTIVSI
jgi:3-oxoacyl-[acyl-carrier-protein] synthase-3